MGDDDKGCVRVLTEELLQLLGQPVTQDTAPGAEADIRCCIILFNHYFFDIDRPRTHVKVHFGATGYWIKALLTKSAYS